MKANPVKCNAILSSNTKGKLALTIHKLHAQG